MWLLLADRVSELIWCEVDKRFVVRKSRKEKRRKHHVIEDPQARHHLLVYKPRLMVPIICLSCTRCLADDAQPGYIRPGLTDTWLAHVRHLPA